MKIGTVAKQVGISVEAVRFYEKQGLIESPPRNPSGYRYYPEAVVDRLFFITKAKELGFSLKEIKELLHLRYEPDTTCADVKQRAETKIADIERRIKALLKINKALNELISACSGRGPVSGCPIIRALSPEIKNESTKGALS